MSFTAIFVMIFLLAFVIIGGVVMFLSKTIDHGEARFGPDGKVITETKPKPAGPARPAQRLAQDDKPKASDHE